MSKAVSSSNREWEVSSAADTLIQAEKIKSDKDLLLKAKAELRRRQEEAQKVLKVNEGKQNVAQRSSPKKNKNNNQTQIGHPAAQN